MKESPAPMASPQTKFYFPQLDGLRSFAFLIVFFTHAGGFDNSEHSFYIKHIMHLYSRFAGLGWAGVDIFFTLSAFLITSILLKEEAKRGSFALLPFFYRRILRIWPVYFLAIFLGLLLFPVITFPPSLEFGTPGYWSMLTSTYFWASTFTLNLGISSLIMTPPLCLLPLWSVSLEEQFYVFWGCLLKIIKTPLPRFLLIAAVFALGLAARFYYQHQYPDNHVPFYLNTVSRLDAFMFGSLLALSMHHFPALFRRLEKIGFVFVLATIFFFIRNEPIYIDMFPHGRFYLFNFTIADFNCLLLLLSVLMFKPLASLLSLPWITKFGRLTYGMYVFHLFVIQGLDRMLNDTVSWNIKVLIHLGVGLPLTFFIAYATWHLIEKRFLRMKEKYSVVQTGYKSQEEALPIAS